ncbi:LytR/AlgR family response regulator transcription factor [Kordiimonas lipolytica]|uniref:LytR/AlgR family response regulator transcription factor n=1 Tax=Kordiimonas lipolytica TaxID=1662421 RepID=A0ABV8U5G1_9PROT|nr:LytTR family DNA-binding domain-containing protein [Kordiimonas lipolytica]
MPYRILIVEDEPLVARRLQRLSTEILGDRLAACALATSVEEADQQLAGMDADVILLDLNLAGEDGFDLLKRFTAKAAHTIIVSAQTDRALEAFEYGVLDFVPKPFTRARLSKAFTRLWDSTPDRPAQPRQLSFETRGGFEVVELQDILYFKAADKYSEALLATGDTRFHDKSLNRLEHILASAFVRTHKSYLVHRTAILDIKSLEGSRYALHLSNGTELPVGRTRIDHVRQLLEARLEA